jgi:hypothetical protein
LPYELWLPDDFRPQPIVAEARLTAEAAPTRMGKYLPEWIWEGEREPFELLTRDMHLPGTRWPLPAQRRGLVDYITVGGQERQAGAWLEQALADEGITFTRQVVDGLTLSKAFRLQEDSVIVTYKWRNEGTEAHSVAWQVLNELCPDYATVVEKGRKVVHFVNENETPRVRNTAAREEVCVISEPPPLHVYGNEGLLSMEIASFFELTLEPDSDETIIVRLVRQEVSRKNRT